MTRRLAVVAAAVAVALMVALPSAASAHAYLVKTSPVASKVLNGPPKNVALTYDEAVEPRFAIISVTNAHGAQETIGPVERSPANPDTLVVPVKPHLPEGWYLIYWRAISVDGHPVQGAFTFAVGPNPGPAPQFPVPSVGGTAKAANLLITRWIMFLSTMTAIGLFVLRFGIARPLVRRVPGTSLKALSRAFVVTSVVGLLAIPVYLDFATASDSLRSVFDVGALVPLFRVTAFGRGYTDMLLCFALFCVAAWIALWLDRADRPRRSVAELTAITGALLAAAAVLILPGASGHAGQTSPRGLSLFLDWSHLLSGSVWIGGLVGLIVLAAALPSGSRVRGLAAIVPRFSNVALASVVVLLASGTVATIVRMPTLDAMWKTGFGVAILVKVGILLVAVAFASGNLLRSKPRLAAGDPGGASLLRRFIGIEAFLVAGAIFTAAVLSSLAPPPPAFAKQDQALAAVGPGRVVKSLTVNGYLLQVLVSPNKAAAPDSFALRITKGGKPVTGADVTLTFNHTEMQMPQQEYQLKETRPGLYSRAAPALVMVGKWALGFQIAPKGGPSFSALILDQADG
jgi:copper transport protein